MASVYRRGRTYWVRFSYQGKEVRCSAQTSSKSVAQHYLAQLIEQYRSGYRGAATRHTYRSIHDRFCVEYLPSLKAKTQQRYRCSFRQLAPYLDELHADDITKRVLADYVSARRAAGATGATIKRDLSALGSLFSFAMAVDMVATNPVRQLSKRHLREAPRRTSYPSDAEIEALIARAPATLAAPIRFLAETGMRSEEALSLEWSQVALHRREVRLTKTKTSAPRIVPLSESACETLAACPRHPSSPFVFWHHDGRRYRQFAGHFRRLARKVGFPYRAHDLRHRFASVFLSATQNLAALQAVLGHRSIDTTMRYAHILTSHLHEAITKAGTKIGTRAEVRPSATRRILPGLAHAEPHWKIRISASDNYGKYECATLADRQAL